MVKILKIYFFYLVEKKMIKLLKQLKFYKKKKVEIIRLHLEEVFFIKLTTFLQTKIKMKYLKFVIKKSKIIKI